MKSATQWSAAVLAAMMAGLASVGVAATLLTPEAVLQLRGAGDVALSPDGSTIAYRVNRHRTPAEPRGGSVGTLWLVPAAGGAPSQVEGAGFDAQQPRWSPDGKALAWKARRDSSQPAQVFAREGSGAPVQLTHSRGDVVSFQWSHDGSRVAYVARDAQSPEQLRAEQEGRDWIVFDTPASLGRLYTMDVRSRAETLVTRADMHVHDFDWSHDDSRFVFAAGVDGTDDVQAIGLRLYTVGSGGGVPRLVFDQRGRISEPRWSADGKSIAWLGSISIEDPWEGSVFVMPADQSVAPRNLMPDYDGTAVGLGPLPGRPRALAVLIEEHMNTALRAIDLDSGRMEPIATPTQIMAGAISFSRDGRSFAVAANAANHPTEAFVARAGKLRRVTDSNPSLAGVTLGKQEITRWKSKDGLEIEGLLVKPVGYQPGKRYPVVLHVHGGSEGNVRNGWQTDYHDFGQQLAARGYVVLYPNYRGSRGRGTDFIRGNRHDLMGREWEDIEGALDHAIALGLADGERAGIYGFSWGGYATGWAATFASHRFKAAVAGAGIFDWISEAGTNDTRMHEQYVHWDSPLYEDFLLYLDRSPIYHVRKANTPLLMLHGEEDPSCPIGQAIEMHTALKWKGTPVELVIYPREGHGMSEPAHQADFQQRGLAWLDRYLRQ